MFKCGLRLAAILGFLSVLTLSGSLPGVGLFASAQQDISAIVERVRPAVVEIVTDRGQGSGVIITSDGAILTAYHVVKGASRIEVRLSNGSSYRANVEKYDETYDRGGSDLALLRVSASGLPTVSLGDSDTVRVGHSIIVMGYPLGMGFLVGTGNISGTVDFGGGRTVFVIDAAVNPGNSGGPLLNDKGEVIGIVFGQADVPGIRVEGINFATPINTAKSRLGLGGLPGPSARMELIPAGSFQMGDSFSEGGSNERPVHTVTVSAFYMDQYEVTKALWDEVANWAAANGYDISAASGDGKAANHPVWNVSWYEAVKWANARSEREGLAPCYYTDGTQRTVYRTGSVNVPTEGVRWSGCGYRLPTEGGVGEGSAGRLCRTLLPVV